MSILVYAVRTRLISSWERLDPVQYRDNESVGRWLREVDGKNMCLVNAKIPCPTQGLNFRAVGLAHENEISSGTRTAFTVFGNFRVDGMQPDSFLLWNPLNGRYSVPFRKNREFCPEHPQVPSLKSSRKDLHSEWCVLELPCAKILSMRNLRSYCPRFH